MVVLQLVSGYYLVSSCHIPWSVSSRLLSGTIRYLIPSVLAAFLLAILIPAFNLEPTC
jgi:hypothetical protein